MNFDFTEEQVMLRDSVARYVQDDYDWETRVAIANSEEGMDRARWQTFAELGWLSIPFAEEHGGFGGNAVDVMVVMEELGKGLVLEPYLATVLLYGGLLQKGGSAELQAAQIPSIIDGSSLGAFAYLERQGRYELADVKTSATASDDGFVLNGEKVVVLNGANADQFIVSARTSGEQSDEQGISLFLVPADAAGLERIDYRMMDGQRVANVVLKNVKVPAGNLVGELNAGYSLIDQVVMEANLALSAEALGIMQQLNAKTVEYTRTREQFGVAISSFQALQHRMVDTFISYEQAKSLLYRAVCALTDDQEDEAQAIHALRVLLDKAGKHIFGEAIQLHGGMGITDELDIGHYAKRLMMINTTFGNGDYHQAQFNALRYN
ncbi:acyl-CoA dehydrogenase family protein [Pseudohalioglobus lutimaris]|uniref:Pimeloyl-CoA dehydrogenase small subunit n=1 Tax=Pseudohalioglobus lutimaris TaxID=1737061 RepID=A0A2N5X7K2_9GAMM|nr:acyl-CoA dehydrogenase family protein [Pseudohalioglobus lutimaris]PLW70463.1 pimeloyl-CoA dehydrogenase small subunit [Pseudohalioglobus lutimaris]